MALSSMWRRDGDLRVWGTSRSVPAFCVVVEVVASGLLVVKHRNDPFGKFVNVAVLEGDEVKIVDEGFSKLPDCPGPVKSLLGFETPGRLPGHVDVLVQLAAPPLMRHRANPVVQGFVKGVYAAAIGAILAAAILLGRRAIGDWITAMIAVAGLVALLRFRISGPLLVGSAAAVGLVTFQFLHPDWALGH